MGAAVTGDVFKAKRVKLCMTQSIVAGAARVSERTVQRLEAGAPVSAESRRAVCAVLGLDAASEAVDAFGTEEGPDGRTAKRTDGLRIAPTSAWSPPKPSRLERVVTATVFSVLLCLMAYGLASFAHVKSAAQETAARARQACDDAGLRPRASGTCVDRAGFLREAPRDGAGAY